jgi:probable HAF family extracellular repeat protein
MGSMEIVMKRTLNISLFIFVVAVSSYGQKLRYAVSEVGSLDGNWSIARSINNQGEVVGISSHGKTHRGFIWTRTGAMNALPKCSSDTAIINSAAYAINDFGQIAGYESSGWVGLVGSSWDVRTGSCTIVTLNNTTALFGVSNTGELAGEYNGVAFMQSRNGSLLLEAVGNKSQAMAIGSESIVVGFSTRAGLQHATLWHGKEAFDLTPNALTSAAYDVNLQGEIVGYYADAPGKFVAFKWSPVDGMSNLGTLAKNAQFTSAYGINNSGDIVGESDGRAFLKRGNKKYDLNSFLPAGSGWILVAAYKINDLGQIVGYGYKDDQQRGFVMTPMP